MKFDNTKEIRELRKARDILIRVANEHIGFGEQDSYTNIANRIQEHIDILLETLNDQN